MYYYTLQESAQIMAETAIATISACCKEIYPNIYALLQILATLPVSTCEPKRMFSKAERTLTSIRSSMSEERLESLLLPQAHRDNLPATEDIIDRSVSSRRLNLVL